MSSIEPSDSCPGLPATVTAELLSSRRRCLLVTALAAAGGQAVVADLADAVLAAERDVDPVDITPADRRAVERDLFETHIPKLTATGLLQYDSMLGAVRLTEPKFARLACRELSGL